MPISQPEPANRHLIRWLCAFVAAVLLVLGWRLFSNPVVGGGSPDSLAARWVKRGAYAGVPPEEDRHFQRLTLENANGWYGIFAESAQSPAIYLGQNPRRPTSTRRTLVLQPIGAMSVQDQKLLADLKDYCEVFFQIPARIAKPLSLDLVKDFRPQAGGRRNTLAGDRQYDASQIIDKLLTPRLPPDAAAYLGLTMADIYVSGLSFNFGLASIRDRTSVYSLARYHPAFWGQKPQPKDKTLILRRSCGVLSHEVGHMFGLTHCVFYRCNMNGANSLADADRTPLAYCPLCRRKLEWNVACDVDKRATQLALFYRTHGLDKQLLEAAS